MIESAATKLKVIGRAGIGVDNVDVQAATDKGICVMNTPHGNSVTTAEHSMALLMSLCRQIPAASDSTHKGLWEKKKFVGTEVCGKTLGLIGCGNIGTLVAYRAIGMCMEVLVLDPLLDKQKAQNIGVTKVESIEDIYKNSDFITMHLPLTDSTKGIINKDSISKMKKGVKIVNCARGGLVIEEDLNEAIESGQVSGAAFDVFEVEKEGMNSPLFGNPNVVCTPHLGASTHEAQKNVAELIAQQISD